MPAEASHHTSRTAPPFARGSAIDIPAPIGRGIRNSPAAAFHANDVSPPLHGSRGSGVDWFGRVRSTIRAQPCRAPTTAFCVTESTVPAGCSVPPLAYTSRSPAVSPDASAAATRDHDRSLGGDGGWPKQRPRLEVGGDAGVALNAIPEMLVQGDVRRPFCR
jgi:hypothetical protein